MSFSTPPKSPLSGIVLLLVAEVSDADTIKRLLATNKENRDLLRKYEHATCAAAIERFHLQPPGNVLSSRMPTRFAIPPSTFALVEELELRQEHIEAIVNSQFLPYWNETKLARQVGAANMEAYIRRALRQCDNIADIEANCYRTTTWYDGRNSFYNAGVVFTKHPSESVDIPHDLLQMWIQRVRNRQYDYIATLDLEDLAALWMLGYLSLQGYVLDQGQLAEQDYATLLEKGTCFGENVLRHGSFFIHSYYCGSSDRLYEHANDLVEHTWAELKRWEAGDPDETDGLRMTLAFEFSEKTGCEVSEVPDKVLRVLSGLPLEDDEEDESNGDVDGEGKALADDADEI